MAGATIGNLLFSRGCVRLAPTSSCARMWDSHNLLVRNMHCWDDGDQIFTWFFLHEFSFQIALLYHWTRFSDIVYVVKGWRLKSEFFQPYPLWTVCTLTSSGTQKVASTPSIRWGTATAATPVRSRPSTTDASRIPPPGHRRTGKIRVQKYHVQIVWYLFACCTQYGAKLKWISQNLEAILGILPPTQDEQGDPDDIREHDAFVPLLLNA